MKKKSVNLIASLVAAVTICSIVGATPVEAKVLREANYTKVGESQQVYIQGGMTNADGSISQATSQATTISNYLSGKYDSRSDSDIIQEFKDCGLTEADFYSRKTEKQAKSVSNTAPTLKIGWAKNDAGNWYYSTDGNSWVRSKWQLINGEWYWFSSLGQAMTGWHLLGESSWYYFDSNCAMVSNTTIDGYTLGSDGKLIQ